VGAPERLHGLAEREEIVAGGEQHELRVVEAAMEIRQHIERGHREFQAAFGNVAAVTVLPWRVDGLGRPEALGGRLRRRRKGPTLPP
jgi:hypothetical protein